MVTRVSILTPVCAAVRVKRLARQLIKHQSAPADLFSIPHEAKLILEQSWAWGSEKWRGPWNEGSSVIFKGGFHFSSHLL